MSLGYFAKK